MHPYQNTGFWIFLTNATRYRCKSAPNRFFEQFYPFGDVRSRPESLSAFWGRFFQFLRHLKIPRNSLIFTWKVAIFRLNDSIISNPFLIMSTSLFGVRNSDYGVSRSRKPLTEQVEIPNTKNHLFSLVKRLFFILNISTCSASGLRECEAL